MNGIINYGCCFYCCCSCYFSTCSSCTNAASFISLHWHNITTIIMIIYMMIMSRMMLMMQRTRIQLLFIFMEKATYLNIHIWWIQPWIILLTTTTVVAAIKLYLPWLTYKHMSNITLFNKAHQSIFKLKNSSKGLISVFFTQRTFLSDYKTVFGLNISLCNITV